MFADRRLVNLHLMTVERPISFAHREYIICFFLHTALQSEASMFESETLHQTPSSRSIKMNVSRNLIKSQCVRSIRFAA